MNIRLSYLFILLLSLFDIGRAQYVDSDTLMIVDGKATEAGEFMRMYRKSLEPANPLTAEDYLPGFILFKLKVADAIREGFDTTAAFRNELNGYRDQLARAYLTDTTATDSLLREAYRRYLLEINAWHILVAVPSDASPRDTLKAWKKAAEIRQRVLTGESFELVARAESDDKSAATNGGNLGYFTVFRFVKPFEDAVYSMKKGEISMPVRTPYGYHIIKVTDIRPSRGRILVAHIMKNAPPGTSEAAASKAEEDINEIYGKLNEGSSFSKLAEEYSDHRESASKGGMLNWFGTGEMIPDFTDSAFAIKDTGSYTLPFRTIYGWHIVKLLDRKAPGNFVETRSYLQSRINPSYLDFLGKKALTDKLKDEYGFKINETTLDWFFKNTDSLILTGGRKFDRKHIPSLPVFMFADQAVSSADFAGYIENHGYTLKKKNPVLLIGTLLESFATEKLLGFENSNLENKYPDFRYLMKEFHDGILLYDISEEKIWGRINHDTAAIRQYYEGNKNKYLPGKEVQAKIYNLKVTGGEKKLATAFKKYYGRDDADKRLMAKFNTLGDTILSITEGTWTEADYAEKSMARMENGIHSSTINGFPAIIVVKRTTDPLPLGFEEVQDRVMNDYQEYLEKDWEEQLKEKYDVKIDSTVLHKVKEKLQNE